MFQKTSVGGYITKYRRYIKECRVASISKPATTKPRKLSQHLMESAYSQKFWLGQFNILFQ